MLKEEFNLQLITMLFVAVTFIIIVIVLVRFILNKRKTQPLITNERRHIADTWLVDHYIQNQDWESLEELLQSKKTVQFPDLVEKINNALKSKGN